MNAGDNLVISTTTPGGTGAFQFANGLDPTINLYDANDNLVATATGECRRRPQRRNPLDGPHPGQLPGPDPGLEQDQPGRVHDQRPGRHRRRPGLRRQLDQPGGRQRHQQRGLVDDGLAQRQRPAIVDLHVGLHHRRERRHRLHRDRQPYASVFTFPTTVDGVHTVSISGLVDIHGTTLTPDSFTFKTDTVPPALVSSSIANKAVLSPGNLTEVITFSEPMNTAFTTASSFDLHGNFRNVDYAAASISWDPTGTILTINYSALPSDAYTLTLYAGGFADLAGNTLIGSYVVELHDAGGHRHPLRPDAGESAGQPGVPGDGRRRPDLLEQRRDL